MEALLTLVLIETFLINTVSELERRKRGKLIAKWATGNITMDEIKILKKQPWFRKAFKEVRVSTEKKDIFCINFLKVYVLCHKINANMYR